MAGLTEAQLKLVADLEMEMMADMYNRLVVGGEVRVTRLTFRMFAIAQLLKQHDMSFVKILIICALYTHDRNMSTKIT